MGPRVPFPLPLPPACGRKPSIDDPGLSISSGGFLFRRSLRCQQHTNGSQLNVWRSRQSLDLNYRKPACERQRSNGGAIALMRFSSDRPSCVYTERQLRRSCSFPPHCAISRLPHSITDKMRAGSGSRRKLSTVGAGGLITRSAKQQFGPEIGTRTPSYVIFPRVSAVPER
jgi:hypothetical protein